MSKDERDPAAAATAVVAACRIEWLNGSAIAMAVSGMGKVRRYEDDRHDEDEERVDMPVICPLLSQSELTGKEGQIIARDGEKVMRAGMDGDQTIFATIFIRRSKIGGIHTH